MQHANKDRSSAARRACSMLFPAIAMLSWGAAAASDPGCSDDVASGDRVGQSHQVVVVDPDTGELLDRPLPAGVEPMPDAPDALVTETLPDGTVVADPGDRLRARLVAEVVDGKLVTCHRIQGAYYTSADSEDGSQE